MIRSTVNTLRVYRSPLDPKKGRLVAGNLSIPCAIGRGGIRRGKREGDGVTPAGRFPLLQAFYRGDRMVRPRSGLPLSRIGPQDGWSDDPRDRRYNQPVPIPCATSHERMWRDDGLYDIVVDIGWNRGPVIRGHGSAIFLHVARPGFPPTEGCVAVEPRMIGRLLERIGPRTTLVIVG
ncbi:L,D-transpeptidase family protein [Microvirga antarctica]|uniref:L,D-transpeptidase family protein n=1 Tax=Microvirga antarctica TaxID=2819233 RepID=UPI001B3150CC|nr:L,D-transpeptidase family protein [Microvirga antarctica]